MIANTALSTVLGSQTLLRTLRSAHALLVDLLPVVHSRKLLQATPVALILQLYVQRISPTREIFAKVHSLVATTRPVAQVMLQPRFSPIVPAMGQFVDLANSRHEICLLWPR
jgi:hypothetical protein